MSSDALKKMFCKQLFRISFGGSQGPVFLNNLKRTLLLDNQILDIAADILMKKALEKTRYTKLCAAHAPAMPLTSVLAGKMNIPIVDGKEDRREYENILITRIDVDFEEGQNCLLIQDCLKSGRMTHKKIEDIGFCGIRCRDVAVFLDFGHGGVDYLRSKDINVYSLITMPELKEFLRVSFDAKPNVPFDGDLTL